MGRGRGRAPRRLCRTAEDSADEGGDGVASRGDVADADGLVGDIEGLLASRGGTSFVWRGASFTRGQEVTYRAGRESKTIGAMLPIIRGKIEDKTSMLT